MSELVHRQRQGLCDMLADLTPEQWAAPTLCAGWDAADVAAHLIVREREPWTAPGLVVGGRLAKLTAQRYAAWKARGHRRLVQALRSGPPWPLSGVLGDSQAVEDWIHEQDIRRGGAGLPTPEPDAPLAEALWRAVRRIGARTLAVGAPLIIELTDGLRHHRLKARGRAPLAMSTSAPPDVIISGPISELLLYIAGRSGAEVAVSGDPENVSLLARHRRRI
ncbi:MAG TPA: maleylpyruvate isomerase family mycothiol-dependent enzyme [Euzebyales bacterium]|nr:maleylpyruvate isomerase family mycothiol-dependent enzyme [Euzebyales bacterium]